MSKKFITKTGETVTFGDVVSWVEEKTSDNCYCKSSYSYTLTEDNAESFVAMGVITPSEEESEVVDFTELALSKIAERMGWTTTTAMDNIALLEQQYSAPVAQIFMKELALELNKSHKESLKKMEYVYGISMITNEVVKIPTSQVVNWESFAAFKKEEDAKAVLAWYNGEKK